MSSFKNIFQNYIQEYKEAYDKKALPYEDSFLGDVHKIKDKLLNERFLPSLELKQVLDKQIRRSMYPMEVAIAGQFSSGKSTFLNALLSKDILPTGITPVTSKVNFINYGTEYKLKITYNSGAQEFYSIESISKFTDQRVSHLDDIKYLTIYAPLEILKDISFVDTPGLNSQSQNDTQTTKNILKDVGGIIWLSMIDNAGKLSEQEILDDYMPYFHTKSLCVLNQKDKFTPEQIQTTKQYIQEKFSKYFSQVSAISAKMALDARALEKHILIENSLDKVVKDFTLNLKENFDAQNLNFFEKNFSAFKEQIKSIQSKDSTKNKALIKESNIQEVLDFINNTMRPNATVAKQNAIKNDLKNICNILYTEYETMLGVYDSLILVLQNGQEPMQKSFQNINKLYSIKLLDTFNSIEEILQEISSQIYTNITIQKTKRYQISQSTFFKQEKIQEIEFESFFIDTEAVLKNLFYDDEKIAKMIKRSMKYFTIIESSIANSLEDIYEQTHTQVSQWKVQYLLIKKTRAIGSDLEFSNIRRFASQIYESILNDFHISILADITLLKKENAYFNATLSYSNQQKVLSCMLHFEEQIKQSEELHAKNPTQFTIQKPREDEILEKLKENFSFVKVEEFLSIHRNYLFKILKKSQANYLQINEQKIKFVQECKEPYLKKMSILQEISQGFA